MQGQIAVRTTGTNIIVHPLTGLLLVAINFLQADGIPTVFDQSHRLDQISAHGSSEREVRAAAPCGFCRSMIPEFPFLLCFKRSRKARTNTSRYRINQITKIIYRNVLRHSGTLVL